MENKFDKIPSSENEERFDEAEKEFETENNTTENSEISDNIPEEGDVSELSAEEAAPEADKNAKVEIVGVKFKKNGKTYHFDPAGLTLKNDDRVIVDTARGQEYGYITLSNREISMSEVVSPLRSVIKIADEAETQIHEENIKKEVEAYNACIALIDKHKLEMKLIDAEISFDRSKLLFYFSAEGRVDFRELVKDLAATFHTRIEMRQIGIRDEAKILGGLGICGRPFCCSSFLDDFVQVSVKMAKEQNLSLNSAKISGACGKLMCCLRYEYDTYVAEKAITPKVDTRVMTPDGPGVVTDANALAGLVKVRLDSASDENTVSVYVREDLVKESEYNGEKLTKTAVPDRSHKNDAEKEFMPVITIEEMSEQLKKEQPEKQPEQKPEIKKNGEKNNDKRRDDRRQEKRKNGNNQNNNQKPARVNDEASAITPTVTDTAEETQDRFERQEKEHRRQRRPNDRRHDGPNPNRSEQRIHDHKPGEPKPDAAPDADASGGNAQHHEASHKKKHRPYYRNFHKNKPSGEGKKSE